MTTPLIYKRNKKDVAEIEPRFVTYPFCHPCKKNGKHAFSVITFPKGCPSEKIVDNINIESLHGKGTRHHGAANLSILLYLLNQKKKDKFSIVTISADGPIRAWPKAILK